MASPIDADGLDALVTPEAAAASLLLVLALWLGSLATYALIKPVDPRNATSSSTTAHLVGRALLPGPWWRRVQAVLLGALGAAYGSAGRPARRRADRGAARRRARVHDRQPRARRVGRRAGDASSSGAMLLVTTVCALTYSAPGIFSTRCVRCRRCRRPWTPSVRPSPGSRRR